MAVEEENVKTILGLKPAAKDVEDTYLGGFSEASLYQHKCYSYCFLLICACSSISVVGTSKRWNDTRCKEVFQFYAWMALTY